MKRMMAVGIAVVCAMKAAAMDYVVAQNGDDGNDGSAARPFRTVQRAADIAVAGDTVTIREGI